MLHGGGDLLMLIASFFPLLCARAHTHTQTDWLLNYLLEDLMSLDLEISPFKILFHV